MNNPTSGHLHSSSLYVRQSSAAHKHTFFFHIQYRNCYCDDHDCLSVCPLAVAYLRNHTSELCKILCRLHDSVLGSGGVAIRFVDDFILHMMGTMMRHVYRLFIIISGERMA